MFKCFNLSLFMVTLLSFHVAQAEMSPVSWAHVAPWCPQLNGVCADNNNDMKVYSLGDLIDAYYRELATVSNEDQADFTDLARVYNDLTKHHGENLSVQDKESVVKRLTLDMNERTALFHLATDARPLADEHQFHHSELRHYEKELRYLTALQSLNQQQIQQMHHLNADVALLAELERQSLRLNVAKRVIAETLKQDLVMEAQLLRYLTLDDSEVSDES
ncbi:hypothetical protein J7I01_004457 [Vibrio parahaemolyticus]|nr:hypothetical protein [Vibrio parahaemolyticus]